MSIVTAPWRLKTEVIVENIRSRITMSLPSPGDMLVGIWRQVAREANWPHNLLSLWEFLTEN